MPVIGADSFWGAVAVFSFPKQNVAILSIENEDPILPGPLGVERAAWVLKNVRAELLAGD